MAWLVVWLVCAVVAGLIAQSKNRSAGAWFAIGLLGGILAVAVLVCLSKLPDPMAPAVAAAPAPIAAPAGDTRDCPHCAETIKAAAKVCRFCNRDVAPVALAATPA